MSSTTALDKAIARLVAVMNARDWDLASDIERTKEYVGELELEMSVANLAQQAAEIEGVDINNVKLTIGSAVLVSQHCHRVIHKAENSVQDEVPQAATPSSSPTKTTTASKNRRMSVSVVIDTLPPTLSEGPPAKRRRRTRDRLEVPDPNSCERCFDERFECIWVQEGKACEMCKSDRKGCSYSGDIDKLADDPDAPVPMMKSETKPAKAGKTVKPISGKHAKRASGKETKSASGTDATRATGQRAKGAPVIKTTRSTAPLASVDADASPPPPASNAAHSTPSSPHFEPADDSALGQSPAPILDPSADSDVLADTPADALRFGPVVSTGHPDPFAIAASADGFAVDSANADGGTPLAVTDSPLRTPVSPIPSARSIPQPPRNGLEEARAAVAAARALRAQQSASSTTDQPSSPPRAPSSLPDVPPTYPPRARCYLANGTVRIRTQTFRGSNILHTAGISVLDTANMLFRMSRELQDEATEMARSAQLLMDEAARMSSDMMDVPVELGRDNEGKNQ